MLRGEDHGQARLTEKQVLDIARGYKRGWVTMKELGDQYGITHSSVSNIVAGKSWKHLQRNHTMTLFKSRLGRAMAPRQRSDAAVTASGDDGPPSVIGELHHCIRQDAGMRDAQYFRPSSIGGCRREAWYHYLRYPTEPQRMDPKFQLILNTGTKVHDMVQNWLARSQRFFVSTEVHVWIPQLYVYGHPDAVLTDRKSGYTWLVEFKSINLNQYTKLTKAKQEHRWQANIYTGLLSLQWYSVVYVCKDNSDCREFHYRFDEDMFDEAMLWCDAVRKLAEAKEQPPFVKSECNETFCKYVTRCRKERGTQGSTLHA
jgi:hypothetical protein